MSKAVELFKERGMFPARMGTKELALVEELLEGREILLGVLSRARVERGTSTVTGERVFDIRLTPTVDEYLALCALADVPHDPRVNIDTQGADR